MSPSLDPADKRSSRLPSNPTPVSSDETGVEAIVPVRINKAIADSGYCARRKADELVLAGRVKVNGVVVTQAGLKINPATDTVTIDEQPLPQTAWVYLALHKPVGYVTTRRPQGHRQKSVYELLPPAYQSADPAGRLDEDSSGLLLFSSDGNFLHGLTHPRFHWSKRYEITLNRPLTPDAIRQLKEGIRLQPENRLACMESVVPDPQRPKTYQVTLLTGYNRQIRRTVEAVGCRVQTLVRLSFGPISLESIPPGAFRLLTEKEKNRLTVPGKARC